MFYFSSSIWRVLRVFPFLLVWFSLLQAATVLNFPRLSHATGTFTGIAIANPTDGAAQVTLTAYGVDGQPLSGSGITNPAVVTVESNQQFAVTTYELFGSGIEPSTVAWFQGVSPTDGLTGFFLLLDGSISYFDGADLPQSARQIVFNEVLLTGDFSTEINLINPTSSRATVEVQLHGGSTVQTKTITLESMGVTRLDVGPFFGLSSYPAKTYVTASANVAIAGFNLVWSQGDVLGANARPLSEQLNTLFFPQLAVLGSPAFTSELVVINYSDETVLLTLSAYQGEGSLFANPQVQNNPVTRALAAGQILREDVAGLFGFTGSALQTGWIKVESSSEAINGSLTYRIPASGSVATVAAEPVGRRQALFSHIATTLGYFTGAAILNGGSLAANLRIVALDEEGTRLGTFTTMLRPGERTSKLITEWVAETANRNGGMIWVSSDVPVFMTGLFVNNDSGVLTNIAPQPVLESFQPDQGQARLKVSPPLAVMVPNQQQTFQLEGIMGPATWSVNGVVGGSPATGTINTGGTYQAPVGVPTQLPVTVSAAGDQQLAAASVDVLSKQVLIGGLGRVQSVAYLGGLQRLYTAELKVLGGAGLRAPQAEETNILDVTGTAPELVLNYPGEEISKMVSFVGIDQKEYLLLAARTSGKILRLNPLTQQSVEVATGLNAPAAIVIDPLTGDLLVAEAAQVSTISASQLNTGLAAQLAESGGQNPPLPRLTLPEAASGLAVDRCTGKIYYSDPAAGEILEYDRIARETKVLVTGLNDPGHLLAFYRSGLSCPDSFQLLVVERGTDRIGLIVPSVGEVLSWTDATGARDIAFLPAGNLLIGSAGVVIAGDVGGIGQIELIPTPELYTVGSVNPPIIQELVPKPGVCPIRQITQSTIGTSWKPDISRDGTRIAFISNADLTADNPMNYEQIFSFHRGSQTLTQITQSTSESLYLPYPELDDDGSRLVFASDVALTEDETGGVFLYDFQSSSLTLLVGETGPEFQDPSIDATGTLIAFTSREDHTGENPDGNGEIFLLNTASSQITQLTDTTSLTNYRPDISADGTHIAYLHFEGTVLDAMLLNVATKSTMKLGNVDEGEEVSLWQPHVNRDGSRVVFSSDDNLTGSNPDGSREIFLYDDGSGLSQLTNSPDRDSSQHGISADGYAIVFGSQANVTGENPEGFAEQFIYYPMTKEFAQYTESRGGASFHPAVSDTGVVAFGGTADLTEENSDGNWEIFVAECPPKN